MEHENLEKYAKLILDVGINLQPGQSLVIKGEPIHWYFVDILQRVAYQKGAKFIKTDLQHACSRINKIENQKDEYLEHLPSYLDKEYKTYVDEKWAMIHLDGLEDPDCFENLDQKRNSIVERTYREKAKPIMFAAMSGICHWTIAPVPTPKWAQKIFGGLANQDAVKRLWDTLIPILRLDQNDPQVAWKEHVIALKKRIKFLDEKELDYLHFQGPETDLKIYLNQVSAWTGGSFTSSENHSFVPNLPTEEIFTTPDFKRTTGKVKITKPVKVLGKSVENAYFEFEEGKVVNFRAENNQESLEKYFDIDPQARYLGEVALVDQTSPITQSNHVFHSILLDENASCHIALGRGISSAIRGGNKMNEKELSEAGCNMSLLHTDFMIGSPELNVTGFNKEKEPVKIIEKGIFQI